MVGTFISKYLLVTTSTITVTSSAAVTFFVAKHLKVGKGYEKMLNYMKERYCVVVNDKSESNQNITNINKDIHRSLSIIMKDNVDWHLYGEKASGIYDGIKSELSKLLEKNEKYLSEIQNNTKRLELDKDYLRLKDILGEYIDSSECSKISF